MPTTEDMQELIDNCEYSWEEVNGVYGAKFTAKNGNSLFFPVPGDVNGLDVKSSGIYAGYWSSSLCKMYENNAYFLNFSDEYAECGSNGVRYYGHPVRAVQTQESMESTEPTEPHEVIYMRVKTADGNIVRYNMENVVKVDFETESTHEYVDLGLPSGTLWATCNIGASQPEEYGDYFSWGETKPKEVYDMIRYKWLKDDVYTKYNHIDSYSTLLPEDDAATVNWGDEWRMPTCYEQRELVEKCTYSWEEVNGVYGAKFTGPNGNSVFFPAAGYRNCLDAFRVGYGGYYWSSSLDDNVYLEVAARFHCFYEKGAYWVNDDRLDDWAIEDRIHGFPVRAVRAQK
ncbi:MAG: hypothetical protein MJZ34_02035 [Paludibacteraceae bacterium]|nr:hypothetical protein [Paludibacteraceae bacterium]